MERHFTVATFVVKDRHVLMLWHRKLQMWLPPGGHIEAGELPDEAAIREVIEETGVRAALLPAEAGEVPPGPARLARPEAIQLEDIAPGHQHIDLVYFAVPAQDAQTPVERDENERVGWYTVDELAAAGATSEIVHWMELAADTVAARLQRSCQGKRLFD